ncbi:MAG: thioredoxin family protein [Nanoarchaeota archaeon]|nr:thioredoxin family protein [Nanoarchaeota archaeon]
MVKKKIRVELLTAPGCSKCAKAKENIKSILNRFKDKVNYTEIDVSKNPKKLLKFGVMMTPAIIINNKLEFEGTPSERELEEKLKEKK